MLIGWRGEIPAAPISTIGQIVTLEIELAANQGFGQQCIHCEGTVIRMVPPELQAAGRVNYMDFRSFHGRLSALEALQPVATSWMA